MNISPKQLIIISVIGFSISMVVHLLTVFNFYLVPNTVIMILTAGILLVWLQSSKNLKVLQKAQSNQHPWKTVFTLCPEWAKYLLYFFVVYAILNFAIMMSFDGNSGYINFKVSQNKLSGLSGFWMVFYIAGLIFGYALNIHLKNPNNKSDES